MKACTIWPHSMFPKCYSGVSQLYGHSSCKVILYNSLLEIFTANFYHLSGAAKGNPFLWLARRRLLSLHLYAPLQPLFCSNPLFRRLFPWYQVTLTYFSWEKVAMSKSISVTETDSEGKRIYSHHTPVQKHKTKSKGPVMFGFIGDKLFASCKSQRTLDASCLSLCWCFFFC
jgi:hypothetical protein